MRYPIALLFCLVAAPLVDAAQPPDVTMTWVEKYLTFRQEPDDRLTLTDAHFLAEIIFDGERDWESIEAAIHEQGSPMPLATYDAKDKRAFTNGYFYTRKTRSFDSLESLDQRHPAHGAFTWTVSGPGGRFTLEPIRIGGPERRTQVPKPSAIRLSQSGVATRDYGAIDPAQPLTLSWGPFEGGAPLPGSDWSDFVFVLVSDCHGKVVYTGGAPGDPEWVDYTETSSTVPAGLLEPGQPYVAFISLVNVVDRNESHGITQLSANSFATELPIRTTGTAAADACATNLKPAQYLWTRKTRGAAMESWPTLADHY